MVKKKNEEEMTVQELLDDSNISMPEGDLQLKTPFLIDGENTDKLHYDFSKLTGRDAMQVTATLKRCGVKIAGDQTEDPDYCAAAFAAASQIDFSDMERMGIADYNEASALAAIFFAWSASQKAQKKSVHAAS